MYAVQTPVVCFISELTVDEHNVTIGHRTWMSSHRTIIIYLCVRFYVVATSCTKNESNLLIQQYNTYFSSVVMFASNWAAFRNANDNI